MLVDVAIDRALERVADRAQDVQHAYTPGAVPHFDDVAKQPGTSLAFDPLAAAPPPDAYFVTTDERGRDAYTRDGTCRLAEGTLVGPDGRALRGYAADGAPLDALRVDPIDNELGRVQRPRIEADGTLCYDRVAIDPRTGASSDQRVVVGRLALARFPAATRLASINASLIAPPAGVEPHIGRPGDAVFGLLSPGRRATSGIDVDRSLDRLREAYLALDAMHAAYRANDRATSTTMDLLK